VPDVEVDDGISSEEHQLSSGCEEL